MKRLSSAQKRVFDAINDIYEKSESSPTIREISNYLGMKSTKAVFVHIKSLQDYGYIKKIDGKARGIRISSMFSHIPLLGKISAGIPLQSESNLEEIYLMEGKYNGRFFLKINGDSMVDAGLLDNGMVLIEKSLKCVDGDIVVALLNGELTIKRFKEKSNSIFLIPENKNYKPIAVKPSDEFSIIGKVIGYIKSL